MRYAQHISAGEDVAQATQAIELFIHEHVEQARCEPYGGHALLTDRVRDLQQCGFQLRL